ncbi:mCG54179, isoform CRA_a [Mus musculus]|nr:mCG54179, isoform CRA_a [Mus musculus]
MLFSPIDPLWVGLIVLVLFVLIYGLCYYLNREAVKTGQKILIEQQESMSEKEKGLKRKRKKKGDTVLSGGQKGQDNRVEAEEEGELASAPPPYASSSAIYGQTFCPEVWKEDRFSLLGCPIFTDQAKFAWDRDMLLGQGRFAQQQTGYPLQVFKQVNQIAIRARKLLPNRGEANENLTFILTSQMVTQVIEVMVSSPRGIVSILPGDQVDQVLTWARGSVCVFPQDQTEPLWVPERLVRRCKNERPDPVAPVDVVDDPTSTKDGAEMRDPFGIPEADTSST